MGVYEENIVPIKISRLAEYMAEKKHLSLDEALMCIYSNPMYKELYDEGAKWWYMSTADLYEEFELASERASQEVSSEAFEFLVYTLEKYALSKGISGLEALALLKRYDEIIVLRDGRVEEVGRFEDLIDNHGYFHALYTVSNEAA